MTEPKPDTLAQRIDAIEEAYEFMLAYAAQGRQSDADPGAGPSIRDFLRRADNALEGLGPLTATSVAGRSADSTDPYRRFVDVLDQDAQKAQAAIQMVLAQSAISSQLIDNLNACIHLRALLTDLFLIDEILKGDPEVVT